MRDDHSRKVPAVEPSANKPLVSPPSEGMIDKVRRAARAADASHDAYRKGIAAGIGRQRAAITAAEVMQSIGSAQDGRSCPSDDSGTAEAVRHCVDGVARRSATRSSIRRVAEMNRMLLASQAPQQAGMKRVSWLPPVLITITFVVIVIGLIFAQQTAPATRASIPEPSPGQQSLGPQAGQ